MKLRILLLVAIVSALMVVSVGAALAGPPKGVPPERKIRELPTQACDNAFGGGDIILKRPAVFDVCDPHGES